MSRVIPPVDATAPNGVAVAAASSSAARRRVVGYDVARALAILGMVVVHFSLAMARDTKSPPGLAWLPHALDGRATATFVLLAGIGVALRLRSASAIDEKGMGGAGAGTAVGAARRALFWRGLILLVVGFVNLVIWPGDILRVYGVCLISAAAAGKVVLSRRAMLGVAAGFVIGFIALFVCIDYGKHWNWAALSYSGLWKLDGVVRNLFYDGFRSVFPWAGVFALGAWLGGLPLHDRAVRRRALAVAVAVTVVAEVGSSLAVGWFARHPAGEMNEEAARYLFGTESMPPLPVFLAAAVGAATAVICLALMVAERWPGAWPVRALAVTGQAAFTWYVAHIVVGLGTVQALGLIDACTLPTAVMTGIGAFIAMVGLTCLWRIWFRHGPLEALLRRVAG